MNNDYDNNNENDSLGNTENNENKPKDDFAQSFGENNSSDTNSQSNPYRAPYYSNSYYGNQEQNGYSYNNSNPTPPKKPNKRNTNSAVIAVCICLMVAIICISVTTAVCSVVFRDNKNGSNDNINVMGTAPADTTAYLSEDSTTGEKIIIPTENSKNEYSIKDITAKTADAVVEITTEAVQKGSFMQQYVTEGAGSGIIITDKGYIVTNNHVIENATKITVRLRNGNEYNATLVGTDSITDIAVVKITPDDGETLTSVTFGDSEALSVGDLAVVIGNPLGELGGTVTQGIISALSREVQVENQSMVLLQTDAAVNPGNSGGGLFNEAGELIGVINAKSSGTGIEGIGFAIPVNTAKPVIEDIVQYGYVKGRIQLGITSLEILTDAMAQRYRVDKLGVYVYSVNDDSDAQKAGLETGDCVLSINGTEVTGSTQLANLVKSFSVGDTINIEIYRYGEYKTISVTFTEFKTKSSFIS